jgi:hypothetical protein
VCCGVGSQIVKSKKMEDEAVWVFQFSLVKEVVKVLFFL